MANLAEQFYDRQRPTAALHPAELVTPARIAPDISPQDFYREAVERPDVRRILTRLAQVGDERA